MIIRHLIHYFSKILIGFLITQSVYASNNYERLEPGQAVLEAIHFHQKENYEDAFKACSYLLNKYKGDASVTNCAYILAVYYYHGAYPPKDLNKSLKWYEYSALYGNVAAQLALGKSFFFGLDLVGKKIDYPKAEKWLRRASNKDNKEAQYLLGRLYYSEKGSIYGRELNYRNAFHWFELSAEKGHKNAQVSVSEMYEKGEGVEPSNKLSLRYLKLAANQDYTVAQIRLFKKYSKGDGVPIDKKKAIYWLERAANNGDVSSMINLTSYYYKGKHVNQDKQKALYWAEMAVKRNRTPFTVDNLERVKKGIQKDSYAFAGKVLSHMLFDKTESSTNNVNASTGECFKNSQHRASFCMVSFDKEFGTGEIYNIDVNCRGGHKAKPCERELEYAVQFGLLDDIQAYCDLENSDNWDVEENNVINNICN